MSYKLKVFDNRCEKCQHVWEEHKEYRDPSQDCPRCGSSFTHTILTGFKLKKRAPDPYDALDRVIPDADKPVKSFANDKRTGGKDRS